MWTVYRICKFFLTENNFLLSVYNISGHNKVSWCMEPGLGGGGVLKSLYASTENKSNVFKIYVLNKS